MMYQMLERCDGAIGTPNETNAHGKGDMEHDQCICKLMFIAHDYGLVLNPEENVVKTTSVTLLMYM